MMNPAGRPALTAAVREAIGVLIGKVCSEAGISSDEIIECVFVGNPIMHHLFLGIDPTELGGAPFALAVRRRCTSRRATSACRERGRACIHPALHRRPCGADAAGATLAEGPHRGDEMTLLVDVGTNAEIVLGNRERLVAASSPTGPALRAPRSPRPASCAGAIERVRIDPEPWSRGEGDGGDEWSRAGIRQRH
jgi:uncharacterized 2Fe-2S/4Fe-4S cluster protein (DUF4445 family)